MSNQKTTEENVNPEIDVDIGDHEIIIGKRYGFFYTLNDILIAIWFIVGSILFFWETSQEIGTWLFLIGSVELLIRPVIRITRNSHLKRLSTSDSKVSVKSR